MRRVLRWGFTLAMTVGAFGVAFLVTAFLGFGDAAVWVLSGLTALVVLGPLGWWAALGSPPRTDDAETETEGSSPGGEPPPDLPTLVATMTREAPAYQDRPEALAHLREAGQAGAPIQVRALTGPPGVGKTQVAAAYARERMAAGWPVVWLSADTIEQVLAGLDRLADTMGLSREGEDADAARQRVLERLDERREPCLLVYDAVDDPYSLRPWMPTAGATQVVVTSAHESVADLGTPVPVETFTPEEALAYLRERTGLDDAAGATRVASTLGHLPVALAPAAAVIRLDRLTYAGYIDRLAALDPPALTPAYAADPCPEGVARAILLALQQVEREHGAALPMLELLSVLAPSGVRRDLIQPDDLAPEEDAAIGSAISALVDASLLAHDEGGEHLLVHRLTQRVLRDRATQHEMLGEIVDTAQEMVAERLDPLVGAWSRRHEADELLPQIAALRAAASAYPEATASLAPLGRTAVGHLLRVSDSRRATTLAEGPLDDHHEQQA